METENHGLDERHGHTKDEPANTADDAALCVPDRSEEPALTQKQEADLACKTRTAALYFATILGLAILSFDMWLTHTTGKGYHSPDWAVAIITATYLGASGNQLAGLLKLFRRK